MGEARGCDAGTRRCVLVTPHLHVGEVHQRRRLQHRLLLPRSIRNLIHAAQSAREARRCEDETLVRSCAKVSDAVSVETLNVRQRLFRDRATAGPC